MDELITIAAYEPLQPIRAGTWKRVIAAGGSLGVDEIFFDEGVQTDDHGHNRDQVAYQVAGRFEVKLNGVTKAIGPGDGYSIPAGTSHSVRCLEKGSYVLITALGNRGLDGEADAHDHAHADHDHHDHGDHDHGDHRH